MHKLGVSEEVKARILERRGRLRAFPDLAPDKMALIVIDMQNCFCAPGGAVEVPASRAIVSNINRLARACRQYRIPVIWIKSLNYKDGADWRLFFDHFLSPEKKAHTAKETAEGDIGRELWKELEVDPDDFTVTKYRYSAMIAGSSNLERLLRSLGKDTVIITGTKTNVCCESTARDAMMLDFKVLFVSDALAALSDEEHQASLNVIAQQFGDVLTSEELLKEIEAKGP